MLLQCVEERVCARHLILSIKGAIYNCHNCCSRSVHSSHCIRGVTFVKLCKTSWSWHSLHTCCLLMYGTSHGRPPDKAESTNKLGNWLQVPCMSVNCYFRSSCLVIASRDSTASPAVTGICRMSRFMLFVHLPITSTWELDCKLQLWQATRTDMMLIKQPYAE